MKRSKKVSKVVIPVAGMGTRFLPVTKALPKELLPIIDKPIIHFIVQEAIEAGLETVVFVTSRPKVVIEDYFDPGDLTSYKLSQSNKLGLIEETLGLTQKIDFVSVRQYEQKGLGHAILQAYPIVNGQDFAVILGDDIILKNNKSTGMGPCLDSFHNMEKGSVIGCVEVPKERVPYYGVVKPKTNTDQSKLFGIDGFVEKPAMNEAPSRWIMPGRYVFEKELMSFLKVAKPGKNNEIQLTDAMEAMLRASHPFFAQKIEGTRYDTGDKLGYIMANVAAGLEDPVLKEELRAWLKTVLF
jgi:UTP--glucose-1-phosphate uridylyltransferase